MNCRKLNVLGRRGIRRARAPAEPGLVGVRCLRLNREWPGRRASPEMPVLPWAIDEILGIALLFVRLSI